MLEDDRPRHIRNAVIAASISAGLTLLVSIYTAIGGSFFGFGLWNLLDVAILLGLAYGMHRRSLAAATLILIYLVFSKWVAWRDTGRLLASVTGTVVFGYFYLRAWLTILDFRREAKA